MRLSFFALILAAYKAEPLEESSLEVFIQNIWHSIKNIPRNRTKSKKTIETGPEMIEIIKLSKLDSNVQKTEDKKASPNGTFKKSSENARTEKNIIKLTIQSMSLIVD